MLSATTRSVVYALAMARRGLCENLAVVLIEIAYVTLTAGAYAAMQQKALGLRSRLLGNLLVVLGVPGLAQAFDWLVHRLSGAAATNRATLVVSVFTIISALFHLHVMRNGVFLSGHGRSLLDDLRRIPRLIAGFVLKPFALIASLNNVASARVGTNHS